MKYVFHLAGLADIVPSVKSAKYFKSNVLGTLNVLEASKKFKIKKLIYAASASCYGFPKIPTSENEKLTPVSLCFAKLQGATCNALQQNL